MYIHSLIQGHDLTAVPVDLQLRLMLQNLTKEELTETIKKYPERMRSQTDFSSSKRLIRAIEIAEYLENNTLEKMEQPDLDPLIIGLVHDLETRRSKINERLERRLKEGLIEEVEGLIADGVPTDMLTFYGLEYKFVTSYLMREIDYPTLKEKLSIAICQFAKRQMTFFRKMEKDGVKINWLSADKELFNLKEEASQLVRYHFNLK